MEVEVFTAFLRRVEREQSVFVVVFAATLTVGLHYGSDLPLPGRATAEIQLQIEPPPPPTPAYLETHRICPSTGGPEKFAAIIGSEGFHGVVAARCGRTQPGSRFMAEPISPYGRIRISAVGRTRGEAIASVNEAAVSFIRFERGAHRAMLEQVRRVTSPSSMPDRTARNEARARMAASGMLVLHPTRVVAVGASTRDPGYARLVLAFWLVVSAATGLVLAAFMDGIPRRG
jgi:hypothetical protein